jgi:hypothetical protein
MTEFQYKKLTWFGDLTCFSSLEWFQEFQSKEKINANFILEVRFGVFCICGSVECMGAITV